MSTLFSEFLPSSELLPYIRTYWMGNFNIYNEKDFSQSVLPNGCIELIIHVTDDHCSLSKDDGYWTKSPEFALLGLYDGPYDVRFSRNVKVFGVRFFPDGIRNIFGIPPSKFSATYEDGADVLGKNLRDFCHKIREAKNPEQQMRLANKFFSFQLAANALNRDYTHLAMKLIRQAHGMADYQQLMDKVPISIRQLQREFKCLYGITVKDYMRLSRMNAIQSYMLSQNGSLTRLTYDLNFTDQSHFIREFKNFAGVAPKRFLNNRASFIANPAVDPI